MIAHAIAFGDDQNRIAVEHPTGPFQNAIRQASQSVSSGLIENITANIDLMRLDAPEKE